MRCRVRTARRWQQFALGTQTLGASRLIAGHYDDNPASGRVLEKLGFGYTGKAEHLLVYVQTLGVGWVVCRAASGVRSHSQQTASKLSSTQRAVCRQAIILEP